MGWFKEKLGGLGRFLGGVAVGVLSIASLGVWPGIALSLGLSYYAGRAEEPLIAAGIMTGTIWRAGWIGVAVGSIQVAAGRPPGPIAWPTGGIPTGSLCLGRRLPSHKTGAPDRSLMAAFWDSSVSGMSYRYAAQR